MNNIFSMTGFAVETIPYGNGINCEIRSLNSRYLETSVKLPLALKEMEDPIRDIIQKKIKRGRVTCSLSFNSATEPLSNLKIDAGTVSSYKSLLEQMRKAAKISDEIKLEHLLVFKEIISFEEDEVVDKDLEKNIFNLVEKTLDKLNNMRQVEGKNLSHDLNNRLKSIQKNLRAIEPISKKNAQTEFNRLHKRLVSMIDENKVDKNRLEMELAIISDRVDISEEIVRLKSHIDLFMQNLENGSPVGKKLNFLLQEMHREANTISSKSTLVEISHYTVEIKEDVERIREQVQNIE